MINPGFHFDNTFIRQLPAVLYTRCMPTPVAAPRTVLCNTTLATALGLHFSDLSASEQAAWWTGNALPPGAEPFAQAYAGHQFGHLAVLGDGRALTWGEQITPTEQRFDLQWKGSGQTPYSRNGDGRAALGPMLREYILSEAMHALGIPTTRSLAVATTGEPVRRATWLPGAVLTRVAASHIRVGTFTYAALQPDRTVLSQLLHYTLNRHDPDGLQSDNPALHLLTICIQRQIALVVHWMRVGFIHGVMNTDNMAISGETLDYGPCAFLDHYHPQTVFSAIDRHGRYAYSQQPVVAEWNIARLAESLLPLIDPNPVRARDLAEAAVASWEAAYHTQWLAMMRGKLGMRDAQSGDEILIADLLNWMEHHQADYTQTFWLLGKGKPPTTPPYHHPDFVAWYARWQNRLQHPSRAREEAWAMMATHNPVVIPRNHQVERALAAAENGDWTPIQHLLAALRDPYTDRPALSTYQAPPTPVERVLRTFCGT